MRGSDRQHAWRKSVLYLVYCWKINKMFITVQQLLRIDIRCSVMVMLWRNMLYIKVSTMQSFEMWAHRKMMKISWHENKTNEERLKRTYEQRLHNSNNTNRKIAYFGHIHSLSWWQISQHGREWDTKTSWDCLKIGSRGESWQTTCLKKTTLYDDDDGDNFLAFHVYTFSQTYPIRPLDEHDNILSSAVLPVPPDGNLVKSVFLIILPLDQPFKLFIHGSLCLTSFLLTSNLRFNARYSTSCFL